MSTHIPEKSKLRQFLTLLIILYIVGTLLFVLYTLWSRTRLETVLENLIDEREISSMTFSEHTEEGYEEFVADDRSVDDFVDVIESGELNQSEEPVYPPSYLPWEQTLTRRPFDSIQSDAHSVYIEFSNGDTETLYFTWDELQVNGIYYTSELRLSLDFWLEFNDEILEKIENEQ